LRTCTAAGGTSRCFFKEIKQTLQLATSLGHNANAVRWQVWTALLTYLLLRFAAFLAQWPHSFTRLFTLLRSPLWQKLDLLALLEAYGQPEATYDSWRHLNKHICLALHRAVGQPNVATDRHAPSKP